MTTHFLHRLVILLVLALLPALPTLADAALDSRIRTLSVQIEESPDSQALYLQRALAYSNNSQPDLAMADVHAAEAQGSPVDAALTHGILLYRAAKFSAALGYFDRYLQAYPAHPGALDYRARLLRDSGESRRALADYESLIAVDDSLAPGYYVATARLMTQLPDRGVDEALALLDARIAQTGPLTPLQRYAIALEKDRGNYQAVIERLGRLDQRLRATPQWQVEVAETLLRDGRAAEAMPYLAVAQEQLRSGKQTAFNNKLQARVSALQAQLRQQLEANANGLR